MSSGLPLGLVTAVRVLLLFFGFRFIFSVSFLLSYSGMLASSCFPRIFWASLNLCGLLFLRFRLWLHLFFALWSSLFRMLRFGRLLEIFLRVIFHMLWLRLIVFVLPPRFSACCGSGCPFLFLSPFSVCCVSFCSMVFFPVFPHPAPPAALHFWHASGCLPCSGFSFGCPSVVRVLFSLRFCWFSFAWFSPPASCFFLVPRAAFSPSACCGVLRSGFGSFSAGSALLCCCGFMVVCFLTRSNLRFPLQRGLPLGRVRLASVFLGF